MIRVLYRWRFRAGGEKKFKRAWVRLTLAIRRTNRDARGSVLLLNRNNPREIAALASWTSYAAWRRARALDPDPEAGATMQATAKFLSLEIFDEGKDLVVGRPRRGRMK